MKNQVEIYTTMENETAVEVRFDQETVWLNRNHLALLFDRDVKTIGKHVNNIFKEGELQESSVVAKFATTAADGKTYCSILLSKTMRLLTGINALPQPVFCCFFSRTLGCALLKK